MISFADIGNLESKGLASYAWGSFQISLSRRSAYREKRHLVAIIAGLSQNFGKWQTPDEFRSFVSLAHETAHYLQDLTTGVGHWDSVMRAQHTPAILSDYRLSTWFRGKAIEQFEKARKDAQSKHRALSEASLFNAYGHRRLGSIDKIREAIETYDGYHSGEEKLWSLRRLLEFDAVLSTWSLISSGLTATEAGVEIAEANKQFFNPFHMPALYGETYKELLRVFLLIMGVSDSDSSEAESAIDAFKRMMPLFVDIALAHPPPTFFDERPQDREHFEPGVRLVRILRALQAGATASSEDSDPLRHLDDLTRDTVEYSYPSYVDIYESWAGFFETTAGDDPISKLRMDMAQSRAEAPVKLAYRRVHDWVFNDFPVFVNMPAFEEDFIYQTKRMIGEEGSDLYWSIRAIERDLGLVELFLSEGTSRYKCPLAKGSCDAAIEGCQVGLGDLDQLPHAPGCSVRKSLANAGFNL